MDCFGHMFQGFGLSLAKIDIYIIPLYMYNTDINKTKVHKLMGFHKLKVSFIHDYTYLNLGYRVQTCKNSKNN